MSDSLVSLMAIIMPQLIPHGSKPGTHLVVHDLPLIIGNDVRQLMLDHFRFLHRRSGRFFSNQSRPMTSKEFANRLTLVACRLCDRLGVANGGVA